MFQQGAQQGSLSAQTGLAYLLLKGRHGIPQDIPSAFGNFSSAADQGHAPAINGLGYMYMYGLGTKQDIPQAVKYFNLAADQGDAEAWFNLGALAVGGQVATQRDFKEGVQYFSQAAQKGNLLAMHKLAHMHLHGMGTPRSCETAVSLFKGMVFVFLCFVYCICVYVYIL